MTLSSLLFSSEADIEKKIYTLIIHSVFPTKQEIKIWTDDSKKMSLLNKISSVKLIKDPGNADLLIVKNSLKTPSQALIFTSTYRALEHHEDKAIGGFYWQKGRPNILFLEPNLKKHHIILPNSMDEYLESSL